MAPELRVILLILVVLAAAYGVVYPRYVKGSLRRLLTCDLIWTVALLCVVGLAYAGTGTRFSMLVVSTNWFVFTLVMAALIEIPVSLRYCRAWGIDLFGPPDP